MADRSLPPDNRPCEAQGAHGELFGFDRISEMIRIGADGDAIARTAQAHGQKDDTTILRLNFAPVGVVNA